MSLGGCQRERKKEEERGEESLTALLTETLRQSKVGSRGEDQGLKEKAGPGYALGGYENVDYRVNGFALLAWNSGQ